MQYLRSCCVVRLLALISTCTQKSRRNQKYTYHFHNNYSAKLKVSLRDQVSWVKIMKHVFKPHIKSLHLVTKERQLVHPQLT